MIRKLADGDINEVMSIWLNTNILAHEFIKENYWRENFEYVESELKKAEVYVYEENNEIYGFVGIVNGYIAGIFIKEDKQSKGFGKELLDYCKLKYDKMSLKVYEKNSRAVAFYKKEGFELTDKIVDNDTKEVEYLMSWTK